MQGMDNSLQLYHPLTRAWFVERYGAPTHVQARSWPEIAAGSHVRVVWRCLLDPAHVWETKVADRTYRGSGCPFHMGNRVHPAESLAAYFPWLAREWHPTRNELRPDQVTRASGREVVWRCESGHEWSAVVYQRTLSGSGCPECYRLEAAERSRASKRRARARSDRAA